MKLDFLKKLAVKLERKNNAVFTYPIEKQKSYLNHFQAPKNDFERAYNQYCCQMKFNGRITTFLLNIVSFPLLIYFYYKSEYIKGKKENFDAVFLSEGISEHVIPECLRNEFQKLLIVKKHGESFTKQDKTYFRNLMKHYPLSWHFLLKCLIKLRFYSYEIGVHSPKAIVVCGEYSFTSSLLTDYCKSNGILHINVMHGEKLFFMRDSFFRFHRCYVWDNYYANLFIQLRADKYQFKVEIPPSLKFGLSAKRECKYDYTYYLTSEKKSVLKVIAESLEKLKKKGMQIAVRPHPRYSNIKQISEMFDFAEIEDISKCSIEESLMRTGCAISLYSTVINQALCNSIPVIIDNISNPDNFKKLEELGYICLKKEYQLLSDIF